jgi:hypothetical protein
MQQNAPFCVLLKNNFLGGGGWQTLDPLPLLVSRGYMYILRLAFCMIETEKQMEIYKLECIIHLLYPHSQSGGYTGIPLSVRPSVRPSLNLVYVTSHLSFVGFYSYLVSWLVMIGACAYYTDFTDG